jgi:hypothetical protein
MRLSSLFQHEGFIANQIYNLLKREKQEPLDLDKLYLQAEKFAELMKNEHLYEIEFDRKKFRQRIQFFADRGVFTFTEDQSHVTVNKSSVALELTDFFCQIMQSFLDTYMITLLTIEQICGKNIVLKEIKIVSELHVALK